MLEFVKLQSDEHVNRNANDGHSAYQNENHNEDAPWTSYSVT